MAKISLELFNLPFDEYITKTKDFKPCQYGAAFPTKLQKEIPWFRPVRASENLGDLTVQYKIYFEAKISYLNQNNSYRLPNLRFYQNIDYFILCFVDTKQNNKPYIYCVPKIVLENNQFITFSDMNGTKNVNSFNTFVEKSSHVNYDKVYHIIGRYNILEGTQISDLHKYIEYLNKETKILIY